MPESRLRLTPASRRHPASPTASCAAAIRPEPLPSQRRAASCSPVPGAAQPSRAVARQLSLAAVHRWIEIQQIRSTRAKPDLSRP